MHTEIYVILHETYLHCDELNSFFVSCSVNEEMYCVCCGAMIGEGMLFCVRCGLVRRISVVEPNGSLETLIRYYFQKGMTYNIMLGVLKANHNVKISMTSLKQKLKVMGLSNVSNVSYETLRQIIRKETQGPSAVRSYRSMWDKLKTTYRIQVKRDNVMNILREEDPEGTLQRKSRSIIPKVYTWQGPNNLWHVDGNDKIKPYGFPIHACIDDFSRKVIWLKVARSNNNRVTPTSYFLKAVASLQVIPDRLQTDCGSENCLMAGIQCKLAHNVDAHRYGSSTSNQRIENFWSHNRKLYLSWIINFF